jgi:lipopolysaccharide export system protein LptA
MKTDKIIAMPDLFRHPWTPQQVRGGIFVAVIALMFLGSLAYAGAPATSSAQPVTISAVKSLEWDRNAKTYTARQDAIATQGTSSIHSDLLTAHYTWMPTAMSRLPRRLTRLTAITASMM